MHKYAHTNISIYIQFNGSWENIGSGVNTFNKQDTLVKQL